MVRVAQAIREVFRIDTWILFQVMDYICVIGARIRRAGHLIARLYLGLAKGLSDMKSLGNCGEKREENRIEHRVKDAALLLKKKSSFDYSHQMQCNLP